VSDDTGRAPALTFDHGAVSVPDLEAAITWYGEMLGFAVARRFALPGNGALAAMLVRGPLRMELFEPRNGEPLPEARRHPDRDVELHGNKHVAFQVEDLAATMRWFEAKGADIAMRVAGSFGSAIFVRDVAGNLIEFLSRPAAGETPS
jgi:methylmalonyl-CoA/ethylmalonyl-CoA epimerase